MSFIMLTESQVAQKSPEPAPEDPKTRHRRRSSARLIPTEDDEVITADKMETANRLFEILSSRSDIDHPICVECTELLIDGLQKRLNIATKERDSYVEFLRQTNAEIPSERERKQAEEELSKAREKEKAAFATLEKLEEEKAMMDEQIRALEAEASELVKEEEQFWRERNDFTITLSAFQKEKDRITAKFDHDSTQLQRLQRTNVYNDTFNIGHDGYFGTINGLRLGRLPTITVEWAEINAAWGQTCLLLATVAERLGYVFEGYRLKPMGSMSIIEQLEYSKKTVANDPNHLAEPTRTELSLYCSGDLLVGFGLFHRRFDRAMVAFLDCLKQLGEFVEHSSTRGTSVQGLKLPYEIKQDKINDISIKLGGFNNEELWTKACKYTLTCCKYLLAHASNVSGSGAG
jgi:beclin